VKTSSIVAAFFVAVLSGCTTDLSKFEHNGDKQKLSLMDNFVHSINELPSQKTPVELKNYPMTELSSQFSKVDIEKLPPSVQWIIKKISDSDTARQKAYIAFRFSELYIEQTPEDGSEETHKTFLDLIVNPTGDCDDLVKFTMGLMVLSGYSPNKVALLAGKIKYDKNGSHEGIEDHMILLVIDTNNQLILLDNLLRDVAILDHMKLQSKQHKHRRMKIISVNGIVNANGDAHLP